jgi:hypothetical protein
VYVYPAIQESTQAQARPRPQTKPHTNAPRPPTRAQDDINIGTKKLPSAFKSLSDSSINDPGGMAGDLIISKSSREKVNQKPVVKVSIRFQGNGLFFASFRVH